MAEAYPQLKANENFLALQNQIADLEDQLQMARRYYNGTVRDFNIAIQTFPDVLLARLTGLPADDLRESPAANIQGGAALLAAAQRELGKPLGGDPGDWYGAVARFSGADDSATAATYANDVYEVLYRRLHSGEFDTIFAELEVGKPPR